jgi:hypothetical protein
MMEKMSARASRVVVVSLIFVLGLACAPSLVPAASAPTFDPASIDTLIVETANAAATQTALIASSTPPPTETPLPSMTPSMTASPTATFVFILFTPTVPSDTPEPQMSSEKFSCQVLSKNPQDDSHVAPNSNFDMVWTVMNNGTDMWDANSTDYRFRSGAKLHKASAFDLPASIGSGSQVQLTVPMKSPQGGGTYSTTWIIKSGQTEFCRMGLTIIVP